MSDDPKATRHTQALERYKLGVDAIAKQLKRETDDLQFQIPEPEYQWSAEARAMRAGSTVGNVAVSAKPMLCIPKLDQPIQLVLNQEKAAHLGVQVHALSEDADDDTADVIQGIYRRIEVDSRAGLARSWAYERAVKCGRGAYRVLTEPDHSYAETKDTKIVIKRILHQESVVLDPFAEEPDWSDGRWGFIVKWMPWDQYTRKFPDSKLAACDPGELADLVEHEPEWMTGDGEARAVLVAEYYCLEYAEDGAEATLMWSIMNGYEILQTDEQDGHYIPIIPVIGREMIPFDKERRWQGIISTNKDGARMFNYAASQAVTVAALEPLAPFQLDPRQIEGYESYWNQANTKQFPYLPSFRDPNKGWETPQRTQIDAGRLGPSMMLISQADAFLHAGTGAFESALGQASPTNKTKGGILALQQQQEQSNSHFLDNLAQISITYEAKVVLDKIPYVYDRPGRVVRTLDLEDNNKTVMLNQPFVKGPNGRPMPEPQAPLAGAVPPHGMVPNPNAPSPQGQPPQKVLHYDLKKGRYGIVVSVGKSYQNRAQQGKDELGQVFAAWPEGMQILGDIYFKFADFPGHREAAERMKKMLPPQLQDKDDPADAEQQLGQAKAQLQQLQLQMQEMAKALETDKVRADAAVMQSKIKASADLQMAHINNATKIAVARISAAKAGLDSVREGQEEALGTGLQLQHEATQNAMDRQHELTQAAQEHQHALQQAQQAHEQAVAQAEQGQAHALEQGDQSQQGALQQQQQAAALAPEPAAE
jgi:hypothetical protein